MRLGDADAVLGGDRAAERRPRPQDVGGQPLGVAGFEDVDVDVALGEVTERHDPAAVGAERGAHGGHQLVERADGHRHVELERHALGADRLGDAVAERDQPLARRALRRDRRVADLGEVGERGRSARRSGPRGRRSSTTT